MCGPADMTVSKHIIDTIAAERKDCMAFASPLESSVVNNAGSERTSTLSDNTDLGLLVMQ